MLGLALGGPETALLRRRSGDWLALCGILPVMATWPSVRELGKRVSCRECGFEQDRGRFCGRCGAAVLDPGRPGASSAPSDLGGGRPPAGVSEASSRASQVGGRTVAVGLALVAVAVSLLVGLGGRSEGEPPAADGQSATTDTDRATTAAEPPAASTEESELAEPSELATAEEPDAPLEGFRGSTDTVLLFDDGSDGALKVDLDTWERHRVELPGQRAGDQPFRLWKLGGWVVVGWGEIWAVGPGQPDTARWLGQATVFLPDAEPDALWLIDYDGGRVGTGTSTWTLVDVSGSAMAEVSSMPGGLVPVRGVPGGLAVDAPNGTLVYDLEQDQLVDNPVRQDARVADVIRDRAVWCDSDPCERLVITDSAGAIVATVGSDETFDPTQVWLSPGGDQLAAGVRVQVGAGVDGRLRVYRTDDGALLADTQLMLGELYGDWTGDGHQFFAWNHFPDHGPPAPANLHRWRGGDDIEQVAVGELGIRDVYGFVTLPSGVIERRSAP